MAFEPGVMRRRLGIFGVALVHQFADEARLVFEQLDEQVPAVNARGGSYPAIGIIAGRGNPVSEKR